MLTKQISCKCECRFDGRKCNSNQKWKNSKCQCEYLEHIIDDSVITFDEIKEMTKTFPTNCNEKKATCKTKDFYFLLCF